LKKSIFFLGFAIIYLLVGCFSIPANPAKSETEAISTTETSIPVESSSSFTFEGIGFAYDPNITIGASGVILPEISGNNQEPYWQIAPRTVSIDLKGYPIVDSAYSPKVLVFPVEDFRRLSEPAGQEITSLRTILSEEPTDLEKIPVLPLENSNQVFRSNIDYFPFQNGSGVRFVGMNSQGIVPVNNRDLFYTYQGLTSDGKYYLAVFFPLNYPNLPPAWDSLPEDERLKMFQDPGYITELAANLSAEPEESFLPDLARLDALVRSITVTP
jgi:hypothetical protein